LSFSPASSLNKAGAGGGIVRAICPGSVSFEGRSMARAPAPLDMALKTIDVTSR
jgi:hypothetical protein